jgi:prepilin signal peptidase PulO-like enzyme (type II secretory pathway)
LIKFVEKYYPLKYNRETKLVLSAIYCFIVLSVGSSLRFESVIGLFNVIGLHFFYRFIKERNINSIIGLLFISVLSISTGLSGLTTVIFPILLISKEFKKIKVHKIIYGQVFLNSILLTVCLFMFNSNLKLFRIDLAETRSLTIYSHNFGVIDEWRRYFGNDGIFNYYNFSLKITAVLMLIAIVLCLSRIFQKSKREINLDLILIFMVLSLASRRGIGAGDVRLAAVLAMFLGYLGATYVFQGLALGFMFGGVVALFLLISRKATRTTRIAFGPYICIGAMAVVLFGV